MPILAGIDGTGADFVPGSGRDARYDTAFADSFVRRICARGGSLSLYRRGPVGGGGGMVDAVNAAVQHVVRNRATSPAETVLLTGYSRGAAGVVAAAAQLRSLNIPVRAMMLFDCVDRHIFIDAETIPSNVEFVHHVMRDPLASSRESFGNDGTRWTPPTVYSSKHYMCTHGGMGGTPWIAATGQNPNDMIDEGGTDGRTRISYRQDAWVSGKIWTEIQDFLATHRFIT